MTETLGVPRPDQVDYLTQAAATDAGAAYKRRLLQLLDPGPGQAVLDLGCGPGTDLGALAGAVGERGRVIGVDQDPVMLAEAARRTADRPWVELLEGDAHALPLAAASVDRARVDRVLMHVADPAQVLAELRRVVRPGGLIALAEPDWDTLVVDAEDLDTSRAFTRFTVTEVVRNAAIGRRLARLAEQAGCTVRTVEAHTPVFRDPRLADQLLALGRNTQRAIDRGALDEQRGRAWFASLGAGPFLAAFTLFTVLAEVPEA
ncbi:methyltransferase domain-containing protein [Kitasatospora sp. NBC_01287]|uniref:methyltransferase domain-containing protein n=1 Tax=Kitasatospora sp. NBC_01287 TaxID=2903573 RepID=UPI002255BA3A|nr:methyltransferase domain-containing protein [Kitasatospora sp. NBC_01287]MCX4750758.1 methyltransferase domain-containing protein [Kitasatospora sp. NBC_01287]